MSSFEGSANNQMRDTPKKRVEVLQEYLDRFFIGDSKRSAKLMIELLVHGYVPDKKITAENVVEFYIEYMEACKCEYPIEKMRFNMCNDSKSICDIILYFTCLSDLTPGSFLSIILGNLEQVKLYVERTIQQSKRYEVNDFNTFRKECHSTTDIVIDKKSEHLFKVVRNPESASTAFDRYSREQRDKKDAYYKTLNDIASFKRDISDFCKSWPEYIYGLQEEQDKFEKFCEIYPAKSDEFAGELERLKYALDNLEEEASQKNGAQRISSGINDKIVNLRAKIEGNKKELQHNFNRYDNREITRSVIQHRANEMVRKINLLLENAYNFAVKYMM